MGNIKETNIRNHTYYFFKTDSSLLKIHTESYKNTGIYYIGYITIKKTNDCENINSLNPLYLMIGKVDRYIEENNGNKYLVFTSTDENKEVLKK